jgi:phosphatidylglycerol:prolipoprotein diacylglycerol transferase
LIHLGPFTLYSFGAMMAAAALAAVLVVGVDLKRRGYDPALGSTMVFAAAVGGLLGARLLFVLEEWESFVQAPADFVFTGAGFTWYGGLIGGALALTWLARRQKIPWSTAADISAPALALSYGIGRIGCHLAGDGDWGTVTTVPWGVAYTNAIIGWVHPLTGVPYGPGVAVHPTPLYELAQSAAIFGILWACADRGYRSGTLFWFYLVLAGLARFAVEFWRVNRVVALGMTEAQWFGLVLAAAGLYLLCRRGVKEPRPT